MGPSDSILKAPNPVSRLNAHIPSAKDKISEPRLLALNGRKGAEFSEGGRKSKDRKALESRLQPALQRPPEGGTPTAETGRKRLHPSVGADIFKAKT